MAFHPIQRRGRKWVVVARRSGRVLGEHDTRQEALAQLRGIEWRMHGGHNPPEAHGPAMSEAEARYVRRAVRRLVEAGYDIGVWDGEEFQVRRSSNVRAIVAACGHVAIDQLVVRRRGTQVERSVILIYGNDPSGEEVVADYSASLEPVLGEISL